ncbi:MAG: hypothetical protein P8179_11150 [Candidatus Thiodiazotropha sp.]
MIELAGIFAIDLVGYGEDIAAILSISDDDLEKQIRYRVESHCLFCKICLH